LAEHSSEFHINILLCTVALSIKGHHKKFSEQAGGMAQVVKHLPSKCDALNSNPSTVKEKFFQNNSVLTF
jgi:hypothetical protein